MVVMWVRRIAFVLFARLVDTLSLFALLVEFLD